MEIVRALNAIRDDLSVLQIKVGALESMLLKDEETRQQYTAIVNEQAEQLIREQQNRNSENPAG